MEREGFLELCHTSRRVLAPAPWSPWATHQPRQQDAVECLWNPSHSLSLRFARIQLFPSTGKVLQPCHSPSRAEPGGLKRVDRSLLARGHCSAAPLTHVCLRDAVLIPAPSLSILGVPKNEQRSAHTRSPYSIQTVRRPLRWSQKSPVPRSERKLTVGDCLRPQAQRCSREAPGDAQRSWGVGQPAELESWQEKQDWKKSRTTFPA